jgi:two-component system cell cycle sensor histidine kinase PleC
VSEGVCLFDNTLRLKTFNRRALELFGLERDKVRRGDPLSAVLQVQFRSLGSQAAGHVQHALGRIERGEKDAFTIALSESHVLRIAMTPLPDGRIVETITDVSDEEQAAAQLRRALSAERSASEAKSSFLASMNHELRTPLNAILGMADAILQGYCGPLSAKQDEYLRDIHAAGKHLRDLIGDILDLSKIESGSFNLALDRCSPEELVGDCTRMVQRMAYDAGVRLEVEVMPGIGTLVIDVRVMKQAILNLLSNAIKFTPAGGFVRLRASPGELGGARIEVADNGIGMNAKDLATAMSLFGQVENVMNRRHSGTGLGLPLARAFVELHGGSLQVDSTPAQGTCVALRLPSGAVA